jgi:hypothetical protein
VELLPPVPLLMAQQHTCGEGQSAVPVHVAPASGGLFSCPQVTLAHDPATHVSPAPHSQSFVQSCQVRRPVQLAAHAWLRLS